jgi:hypothetical protein
MGRSRSSLEAVRTAGKAKKSSQVMSRREKQRGGGGLCGRHPQAALMLSVFHVSFTLQGQISGPDQGTKIVGPRSAFELAQQGSVTAVTDTAS